MERKIYSKPFLVREKFEPQTFCSGCTWVIDAVPSSSKLEYIRLDWMNEGVFDHRNSTSEQYTERAMYNLNGHHLFGTGIPGSTAKFELVHYNVYKYVGKQIDASTENGDRYDNGNYVFVTNTLLKSNYGYYYLIDSEGAQAHLNRS